MALIEIINRILDLFPHLLNKLKIKNKFIIKNFSKKRFIANIFTLTNITYKNI
jgi:hypothetical protein